MRGLCQSFHSGIACNHFEPRNGEDLFSLAEDPMLDARDAGDCDRRAHAMQFAAFF
jgi:hypothetical protein